MQSGNETKHSVTPAGTSLQARPDPPPPPPRSATTAIIVQICVLQAEHFYFIVYADTEVPWSSD